MHTHAAKHKIGHTVLGDPNNTHHRKGQTEERASFLQIPFPHIQQREKQGIKLGKSPQCFT